MVNPIPLGIIFRNIRTSHLPLYGFHLIKSPERAFGGNAVQDGGIQKRVSGETERLGLNNFGKSGIMCPERLVHTAKRLGDVLFPVAKVTPQREINVNSCHFKNTIESSLKRFLGRMITVSPSTTDMSIGCPVSKTSHSPDTASGTVTEATGAVRNI